MCIRDRDLALPGASGLAALPELRELRPTVPLVILSASEEPLAVRQALKTGAMGYIPKSCSSHEMVSALRLVMAGEIYIPPALLAVLETVATAPDATVDPAAGAGGPETTAARALPARSPDPTSVSEEARFDGLTPRQLEVLSLIHI